MDEKIIQEIEQERRHQDQKWGGASHDDLHNPEDWVRFLFDYVEKAEMTIESYYAEPTTGTQPYTNIAGYRHRLVQVAALAVAAIEAFDRADGRGKPADERAAHSGRGREGEE